MDSWMLLPGSVESVYKKSDGWLESSQTKREKNENAVIIRDSSEHNISLVY